MLEIKKFWNEIIRPSGAIVDEDQKRLSITLSTLLILILPLIFLIGIVITPYIEGAPTLWSSATFQPALSAVIVSFISYGLNRTGRYETALWFYVIIFIMAPWWAVVRADDPIIFPIGILMLGGNMMASILSRNWLFLILTALLSIFSVAALPWVANVDFIDIVPVISVVTNLNVIILILAYYRNKLEGARINERIRIEEQLRLRTDELENYKNSLELKVEERTQELSQSNKDLRELQSQLVQSEKMASLGTITSGVAHEINNPLQFIQSGLYILKNLLDNRHKNQESVDEAIRSIDTGVQRASNIVNGLAHFSQISEEGKRSCEPHEIIEECLKKLEDQYVDRVEITRNFADGTGEIEGKQSDLYRIFLNVLENSVQSIKPASKGSIDILTHWNDHLFTLEITDSGRGIKKGDLNKIFDPFFTTKDPGEGTGLGLFVTHNLIKQLNGDISIKSNKGSGTTVTIQLPQHA